MKILRFTSVIYRLCLSVACMTTFLWGLPLNADAQDATWNLNPVSRDWNTAANWTPATVPTDTATFGVSNRTAISSQEGIVISNTVFSLGASSYTFSLLSGRGLSFLGDGIMNSSGVMQNFIAQSGSIIFFLNFSSAGDSFTVLTAAASSESGGSEAEIQFVDFSTGGSATLIGAGAVVSGANGGLVLFTAGSSARMANILNKAGLVSGALGGVCQFLETTSAANSAITCEGATTDGATGGTVMFLNSSTAANSAVTASGGSNGGLGGTVLFSNTSSAGNSTLTANGAIDEGTGGSIQFENGSKGVTARVEAFGGGNLDISPHNATAVTIGSVEGDGRVFLGGNNLTIGSNGLSTSFSGVIQDGGLNGGAGGSLTKIGTGTLTLSGPNAYTGGTTIEDGTLLVQTKNASATGTGRVEVNAGTLGGRGKMSGAVTIGSGTGTGAFLAPGVNGAAGLTTQSSLTFNADGIYSCQVDTNKANADKITAKGVTINSGALFSFVGLGNQTLAQGTVFTVINNTSHNPITGTFSNLLDGSIITIGSNTFQAYYEGGDGNDLTLTVVP